MTPAEIGHRVVKAAAMRAERWGLARIVVPQPDLARRANPWIDRGIKLDPALLLDYLGPFVEPTQVERFRFSREWMRTQFARINNPRSPTYTVAMKLNLPPAYLLIHRTWLGGIGVLSQLEAEAPFRAILEEYLPGFAEPTP